MRERGLVINIPQQFFTASGKCPNLFHLAHFFCASANDHGPCSDYICNGIECSIFFKQKCQIF